MSWGAGIYEYNICATFDGLSFCPVWAGIQGETLNTQSF